MESTAVNSWITLIGTVITVGSIWAAYVLNRSSRSDRRVEDVASRFIGARLDALAMNTPGETRLFLAAGALSLDKRELEDCVKRIKKAAPNSRLQDPLLMRPEVLREAAEAGVDLDDWAERVSFLIKVAMRSVE